ncbi:hypothetical protein AMST5_00763 [freshwater sediment metagenome]|uniref:Uncharacterized protein n=1 Tax=freshwater sediment metagenome TaxID=556182 RepID=A0AA48RD38_9ZZZZ
MTSSPKAIEAREKIRAQFPDDYDAGARAGFTNSPDYPSGFHSWSLERRDAFFAGYNAGRCDRPKINGKNDD